MTGSEAGVYGRENCRHDSAKATKSHLTKSHRLHVVLRRILTMEGDFGSLAPSMAEVGASRASDFPRLTGDLEGKRVSDWGLTA